ncbi:MAG: NAD-dependent epimerase/dehydratase family protein [Bacteroidales bacterium]|nr:NAD-dependent epimerase/dehydratase family protein [Bacteroidales bacterium]
MNILITGGAGYVGYSLVRELDKDSRVSSIVVYDNLYRNNLNFFTCDSCNGGVLQKTRFAKGDILDDYTLEKELDGIDIVVHMAAIVDFPYSYKDNYLYEQTNQFGTANLVSSMRNSKVKKMVYLSSGSVYGFQKESYEQTTPMPENGYGISKLEGEKYCRLLQNDLDLNIVRIGNIYGYNPMLRYDSVINRFIMDALIYNKIYIYGNGNQSRPFIYLGNVTEQLKNIILPGSANKTPSLLNLVDENLNMNQLRDMLISLIPNLEFTYVNANLNTKGYEMFSNHYKPTQPFQSTFEHAFRQFPHHLSR